MSVLFGSVNNSSAQRKRCQRAGELRKFMAKHELQPKDVASYLGISRSAVYAYLSEKVYMADVYWASLKKQKTVKK